MSSKMSNTEFWTMAHKAKAILDKIGSLLKKAHDDHEDDKSRLLDKAA